MFENDAAPGGLDVGCNPTGVGSIPTGVFADQLPARTTSLPRCLSQNLRWSASEKRVGGGYLSEYIWNWIESNRLC